jgi:hypothetical protein
VYDDSNIYLFIENHKNDLYYGTESIYNQDDFNLWLEDASELEKSLAISHSYTDANGNYFSYYTIPISNSITFSPTFNIDDNNSTDDTTLEHFLNEMSNLETIYDDYCTYFPDVCFGDNSSSSSGISIFTPSAPQTVNIPFAVAEGDDGGEEYNLNDFTNFTPPVQSLPGRNEFYAAFPKKGTSGMTSDNVYKLVGGSLLSAHNSPDVNISKNYQNACAIRVSRALNYTTKKIPIFYDNDGKQRTQKGGDNLNYILDAASLLSYMQKTFKNNPPLKLVGQTPSQVKASLNGKWGIYIMIPKDRTAFRASGHADFWSYSGCLTDDYLDSAKQIYFWELK